MSLLSGMLLVLCRAIARCCRLRLTHISTSLRLSVLAAVGEVVDLGLRVYPDHSTAETPGLCFTFARKLIGARRNSCGLHRRWGGRSLPSDRGTDRRRWCRLRGRCGWSW